jgi:ABC-type iron transport system FetAB ATPase subunit
MLPSHPHIFHGRDSELQKVVNILIHESPRIAILGAGGMGKTSLATAALHHPDVVAKYPTRYFVPCESAPTCAELVVAIANYVGVPKGSGLLKKVVLHLTQAPPSLLVLDNFETPWEAGISRPEVEEFLSLLADIGHLGLIVSLQMH